MTRIEPMRAGELEERIGDPSREKWLAFLAKALELGYITQEEHSRRAETLLAAKTGKDMRPAYSDLPWTDWNNAWEAGREKGLYPANKILPDALPEPSLPALVSGWTDWLILAGLMAFIFGGWILFFLGIFGVPW